jgi:ADP-ribose pyrophosphatase YjhB (NUDIX family)
MPTILLAGCAILKSGKILLIRKKGKEFWELPGGIVQTKRDIETAAVSKTKSQIGVEPVVIQQFVTLEYQKAGTNTEAILFECDVDPDATFTPGENIEEVKWLVMAGLEKENVGDDVKAILDEIQ